MQDEDEGPVSFGDAINEMMQNALRTRVDQRTVYLLSQVYAEIQHIEPEKRTAEQNGVSSFIECLCHAVKISVGMCGHPDPHDPMHVIEHNTELRIQAEKQYEEFWETVDGSPEDYTLITRDIKFIMEGINERV